MSGWVNWGNPLWILKGGGGSGADTYYLFRSGRGDPSAWEVFQQARRNVTIGTNSINIGVGDPNANPRWVDVQYKTPLDSVLPNYNTLYVEFQFSELSGGSNSTKAFGLVSSLRTSQGDYSWKTYKTFAGASLNTRVTLSLDVSRQSTGYFAFEGPMLGDVYNIWLSKGTNKSIEPLVGDDE